MKSATSAGFVYSASGSERLHCTSSDAGLAAEDFNQGLTISWREVWAAHFDPEITRPPLTPYG